MARNQSIIAVPPNVGDPVVLRRVLSRVVEVLDQVIGVRASETEGSLTQQEFSIALDTIADTVQTLSSQVEDLLAKEAEEVDSDLQDIVETIDQIQAALEDIQDVQIPGRVRWRGQWVDGETYLANDMASADYWTSIANKTTTDSPAILEVGDPYSPYDGTGMTSMSVSAAQIVYGQAYYTLNPIYVRGVTLSVVAGHTYTIVLVVNDEVINTATAVATTTTIDTFGLPSLLLPAGSEVKVVALTRSTVSTPVTTTLPYNYLKPNNVVAPGAGEIVQATKALDSLMVSTEDNDSTDQSTFLASVVVGDQIQGPGILWTVQAISDEGAYYDFTVLPARQGITTGVFDFDFISSLPSPQPYEVDLGYWSGQLTRGLFAVGGLADAVEDDNAYYIFPEIQLASLSPDWDPVITNGGVQ